MSSEDQKDIVQRLVSWDYADWDDGTAPSDLMKEAADEIESLRRAVKAMAREIEGLKNRPPAFVDLSTEHEWHHGFGKD